jgi:hypothetical protein
MIPLNIIYGQGRDTPSEWPRPQLTVIRGEFRQESYRKPESQLVPQDAAGWREIGEKELGPGVVLLAWSFSMHSYGAALFYDPKIKPGCPTKKWRCIFIYSSGGRSISYQGIRRARAQYAFSGNRTVSFEEAFPDIDRRQMYKRELALCAHDENGNVQAQRL